MRFIVIYFYIFIVGLILGSFYNVVGIRVSRGQSIAFPSSHCPNCRRKIPIHEMIPFISYLFLLGKCRGCGIRISLIYPIVEISCALLFVFTFIIEPSLSSIIMGWLLISLLLIIFVSDITDMIIPDKVLIVFFILFIFYRIIFPISPWWQSAAGSIAGFFILFSINYINRGSIGGGDIKLFTVLGYLLGLETVLLALFLSAFFGAVIGGGGQLTGWLKKGQPIPFGPFISLGTLMAFFFGEQMMRWYVSLVS
ncbi:prepilin peptidase [Scopulibacillus cellulosilyticus]|uniref:Prepilin peptidase n=1 Tax=Scopulibacillus cellulosilyticus TaxID=2665665 RepID=A0ABW2PX22_9BACL